MNVRAVFDYSGLGLCPIIVIVRYINNLKKAKMPEGIVSIREAYGPGKKVHVITALVPFNLLREWMQLLESNDVSILKAILGVEYRKWNPAESPIMLLEGYVVPILPEIERYVHWAKNPPSKPINIRVPDPYDLALLHYYMKEPPWKPLGLHPHALADGIKPLDSRRLSDHWRNHVKPYWLFNTYRFLLDQSKVPIRLLVLEGRDAWRAARGLSLMPYVFSVFINRREAAIIAQFPCALMRELYRLLSELELEVSFDLLLAPSLVKWAPRLWRFVRKKGRAWEWCMPNTCVVVERK